MIKTAYLKQLKKRNGKPWQGVIKFEDGGAITRTFNRDEIITKTDARRALEEWRREIERDISTPDARTTIQDYAARYVEGLATAGAIEPSTYKGYVSVIAYMRDSLPAVALKDLTPEHVQEWENGLTARGLSPSSVGKCHRLLKQVCKHAVNMRTLVWNPCDPVRPPRRKPPAPNALDANGRAHLMAELDRKELSELVTAAYIALYTGMREAEICALRWADIDADAQIIKVTRAIGTGNGGTYVKTPKTASGRRSIPIPAALMEKLEVRRARMLEEWNEYRRAIGAPATPAAFLELYICGKVDGAYKCPTLLSREWAAFSKALGLKGTERRRCTFHDLRHTYATVAIAGGADVKSVSSNLGHANAAITLNVYASADADAKRRAAEIVAASMERGRGLAIYDIAI